MKYAVVIFVCLLGFNTLFSQSPGTGPHGGGMAAVHEYFIEFYSCSDYYEVYVYNGNMAPVINSDIKGNITFHFSSAADIKSELTHYGVDGFTVKSPDTAFESCTISLRINGRPLLVSFKNNGQCLIN